MSVNFIWHIIWNLCGVNLNFINKQKKHIKYEKGKYKTIV